MRKLRILVSAYACEPNKGSEPGVGWNWVKQISNYHEVWVITRANNRNLIESEIRKNSMTNIHWIFFDLPKLVSFWKKGQRGIHVYYYLWQIGAYFIVMRLYKRVKFDIIHHVTFVNYWLPSFLSLLPVRFIWGPVGGGESAPKSFYNSFSLRGKLFEYIRNIVRYLGGLDPFVRLTARRSKIALATSSETEIRLKKLGAKNVYILSQVALSKKELIDFKDNLYHNDKNIFIFISIGRMIHWKGFHFGIKSFSRIHHLIPKVQYWFIGEGGEQKYLKRLSKDLGVIDKVVFWGNLPRKRVLEQIKASDVLVHPSLHDSGGYVISEAMAAGKPVICLDIGGPALQVTEETGFKILAINPEQVVEDMAKAMLKLAQDPELRRKMGEAGRKRVEEHFNWDKKGEFINQIYKEVLSNK